MASFDSNNGPAITKLKKLIKFTKLLLLLLLCPFNYTSLSHTLVRYYKSPFRFHSLNRSVYVSHIISDEGYVVPFAI